MCCQPTAVSVSNVIHGDVVLMFDLLVLYTELNEHFNVVIHDNLIELSTQG